MKDQNSVQTVKRLYIIRRKKTIIKIKLFYEAREFFSKRCFRGKTGHVWCLNRRRSLTVILVHKYLIQIKRKHIIKH